MIGVVQQCGCHVPYIIHLRAHTRIGGDKFVVGSGSNRLPAIKIAKSRIINPYGYDAVIQTGDRQGNLFLCSRLFLGGIPLKDGIPLEEWSKTDRYV